jgi:hypothetical protein
MNGNRPRRHSRPKELQTRRIPQCIITLALSSLVFVAPSSQSPSPSPRPPRLHHASVRNSHASSLRSSIPSSSSNPSPSHQNGPRPRGLPHIRSTLEIVLPQPLTPTSFADHIGYGGASSVNGRDSHGTLCRLMGGGSHLAYVITRPPHR